MRIKGVGEHEILAAAASLGLKCENQRWQGRYFCFVLRMAGSRMDQCGHKSHNPGEHICTRKVHRTGNHIERNAAGKIVAQWTMGDFVHPAYRYRKRGYSAIYNGSDAFGGNGAVCFHGHKRFMEKIFAINPEAQIRTKMANYLGLASFREQFPAVGAKNIGSVMCPVRYDEACDCDPSDEHEVTFGTLLPPETPGGEAKVVNVRQIRQGDLKRCPFVIFNADHYREDGSCKCDDPEERKRMIEEWDYTPESFKGIPLREA